jgi:hypothetical protein
MSRGRPRHHGSRRRAYSTRQREVRERRLHVAQDDTDWSPEEPSDLESTVDDRSPGWTLHLQGRPAAA